MSRSRHRRVHGGPGGHLHAVAHAVQQPGDAGNAKGDVGLAADHRAHPRSRPHLVLTLSVRSRTLIEPAREPGMQARAETAAVAGRAPERIASQPPAFQMRRHW